ncbi:MAG: hypothetical protein IKK18_03675, partial [Clostridia bacterium]|nr:hypothetical protein [Clostridia bacterium]
MDQRQVQIPQGFDVAEFFGDFDSNVKLLEKALSVSIVGRDNLIKISGDEENLEKCSKVIDVLMEILEKGEEIDEQKILYAITMVQENGGFDLKLLGDDCVAVSAKGTP